MGTNVKEGLHLTAYCDIILVESDYIRNIVQLLLSTMIHEKLFPALTILI